MKKYIVPILLAVLTIIVVVQFFYLLSVTKTLNQRITLFISSSNDIDKTTVEALLQTYNQLQDAMTIYDNNAAIANDNAKLVDGKIISLQNQINAIVNYLR